MAVPSFQSWLLPLLKRLEDGEVHHMGELYEQLADDLDLSDVDREEKLPSGAQLTYYNRIAWARTYLKKAGLVASPGRSRIQITERGRATLGEGHEKLTVRYLQQFPEFLDFQAAKPAVPLRRKPKMARLHRKYWKGCTDSSRMIWLSKSLRE